MSESRAIPPAEAREWQRAFEASGQAVSAALARTAAVLGEQREAVLALLPKRPAAIWRKHADGGDLFDGFEGGPEHRTVGEHRAWCYDYSEWCYPTTPCQGCVPWVDPVDIREALGVTD